MERRLAAIVAADMVGYSRLMADDEVGTLTALKAWRRDLIDPKIAEHQGRIVKSTGDGLLVEFASAVNAVRCALELQEAIGAANKDRPEQRAIELRIGINVGDLMIDSGDIFGDGVNVAARLQELSEPGGIAIASSVYEHAAVKPLAGFRDGGEHRVKNIDRPIHVWRWRPEADPNPVRTDGPSTQLEKRSIAVLPFTNMSGDQEQEYFADGVAEDIITGLSHFRSLFVIARNSTFIYKGRSVDVKAVGWELKVRYVLEGSVRKAGNRVRITAQLINAETGAHVWAQRYDRDLTDIFAVQDEVTVAIVAALAGQVEVAEVERAKLKPPSSLDAYDLMLRAKERYHRLTKEDNAQTLALLEQVIARDPNYAQAHAWLACTLGQGVMNEFVPWTPELMRRATDAAEHARALDENDSDSHRVLSDIRLIERRYELAEFHHERAIALNPNEPRIVSQRGELLMWLGRPDQAVEWIEKAMQLDPAGAARRAYNLGRALFSARRYADALGAFARSAGDGANLHAYSAGCEAQLDRPDEAARHRAEVLRLKPEFSAERFARIVPYKEEVDRDHLRASLTKAGLPS